MKIEIDLGKIYTNESPQQIKDAIEDAVAYRLAEDMGDSLTTKIEKHLKEKIEEATKKAAKTNVEKLFNEMIDTEFTPKDRYGKESSPTTLRKTIMDIVASQANFNAKSTWNSDKTVFQKCVEDAYIKEVKDMRNELFKVMNSEFKRQCISEAAKALQANFK